MIYNEKILVGMDREEEIYLYPSMCCRHGLIAGATGTGKTTTLKVLAESFSSLGVPVFLADIKGDLGSLAIHGIENENAKKRIDAMKLLEKGFRYQSFPVNFFDVYGKSGMPLRTTISELGPLLLSKILMLSDVQTSILTIIFKIADDEGLLLIDTKDLKSMIQYVNEKRKEYSETYGNMSPQSLASILRAVIALEQEGADEFIGEPALDIHDWLQLDENGKGMVQLLDCRELYLHPQMYSMFLLWLLSELFETLPEAGDLEKPKMVFFFDEAHLLFSDTSKVLVTKIEQVVKLIRSKGVGVYFITQSPSDVPGEVLSQLGNKIVHALHAYTPAEQKKLKAAAMSFRENPELNTYDELQSLGVGSALVSVLDEDGIPTMVRKTKICPPESLMGTLPDEDRNSLLRLSDLYEKYKDDVDRDSAYEFLERRRLNLTDASESTETAVSSVTAASPAVSPAVPNTAANPSPYVEHKTSAKKSDMQKKAEKIAKDTALDASGTIGAELGRKIGSIGGSFGKKLGASIGRTLGRGIIGTFFGN